VTTTPIELLDGPDEPELTFLHEILHVEALPDEATRISHDEAKVGSDELVDSALGLATTAGESTARTHVSAARSERPPHPIEERTLEALDAKLCRYARTPTTDPIASHLVAATGTDDGSSRGALQEAHQARHVSGPVSIFGSIAEHRRRNSPPVAQLGCQGAQRASRLSGTEQRLERGTLATLYTLRELNFLLMR
jgi:hypothetical protein